MNNARYLRYARSLCWFLCASLCPATAMEAHSRPAGEQGAEIRLHLTWPHTTVHHAVPAVLWLEPLAGTPAVPFISSEHYTLAQKNRMFLPHLLVVPVGAVVQFPNKDPFFHNVFSLFDGKRFDLGLYEAGSSKSVNFSREGVSYIFCNIHPEMSAVVVALSNSLYAVADHNDTFLLTGIPSGDYRLHLWIEGIRLSALDALSRPVHITTGIVDLGELNIPVSSPQEKGHTNKFGQPYAPPSQSPY
ncbi:cupredoxin domain-containing protein [Acidicapsa acidisoli]|uniref:hypothetical protein n=1 Tax=Acidicapsa acidisoli TaxID=1615681 RepID=UPI0021DF441C|nr:hypothetical protein [Acidicapsa acidisoli]